MREQVEQPLLAPGRPPAWRHSRARWFAFVVGLVVGSLHSVTALAQMMPAASASANTPRASAEPPSESEANTPEVARRLWHDLLCTCTEKDCVHESLEACTCEYAEKRRNEILAEVRRLGFGSTKQDDATYATVFRNYLKAHGKEADGTQAPPEPSAPIWLDVVLIAAAIATAVAMITFMVDRFRGRPLPAANRTAGARPNRGKKTSRKRR